jgi:molecular chaperone DnaK
VLAFREALFCGGEAFDDALVAKLAAEFQAAHGIDLTRDHLALSRLLDGAERARHELSSAVVTEINLPFITADASGPKHLNRQLSRSELEAAADGRLREFAIDRLSLGALADAGMRKEQLGMLVLSGGMMRTPHLRARVERALGLSASESGLNPEDLCVLGAVLPQFSPAARAASAEAAEAGSA